jgi:hypothetical protein
MSTESSKGILALMKKVSDIGKVRRTWHFDYYLGSITSSAARSAASMSPTRTRLIILVFLMSLLATSLKRVSWNFSSRLIARVRLDRI